MISVAITTFNRSKEIVAALEFPSTCGWVDQIVVCDDASADEIELRRACESAERQSGKTVQVLLHNNRLGPFGNKLRALSYCRNDFAALLDSDNALTSEYLSSILTQMAMDRNDPWCIYCPAGAHGDVLDYGRFAGLTITKENIGQYLSDEKFQMLLNTGNYVVPVKNFQTVAGFYGDHNPYAADVIYANYRWLEQGGKLKIVADALYWHSVHAGSIWGEWQEASMKESGEILRKMEAWS